MKEVIRKQLISTLEGKGSHVPFSRAIEKFPFDLAGKKVRNLDHTAWSLVFHIWIAPFGWPSLFKDTPSFFIMRIYSS